jgi:glutamate synthase (NADPH/NADH) small chain
MGKPTGFMEYQRELPPDREPRERIKDWQEFHLHLAPQVQTNQGARCMDCGIPFCHTGRLINGMATGCPINNLIPEWNDLIFRGLWREALERLAKTNNFPEFTGRVCPAPCEGACTLGINEPPVTIKNNECAIIDHAFAAGWMTPRLPKRRTHKKVAVIGSGPSGLACAAQLNAAGHSVTVFERADRIGGLLTYGIPNMKLDKKIVQRRIDLMAAEGVAFRPHTEVGRDFPVDRLKTEFDAVVLCGGATKPRDLAVEGRQFKGVHFAMDFLRANTKSLLDSNHRDGRYLSAKGLDVIVIGGGDTGTDCVGTALRHGCKSVVQFEIVPQAPLERSATNPWPQWPVLYRVDYGQEEAAALYGKDPRLYCINTVKMTGDAAGAVQTVETVQVNWEADANGRRVPKAIPGTKKVWPAQMVLLALGFLGPEDSLLEQLGIARDHRSNVKTDSQHATNQQGIFAAGDMRRGQSLVVWAIQEGRAAARECDRYLMGKTMLP